MMCVQVYANDLNPESVHYMAKNVVLNRISSKVHVFKMDGREFVRLLLATPGGPAERLDELRQCPPGESSGSGACCRGQSGHLNVSLASRKPLYVGL